MQRCIRQRKRCRRGARTCDDAYERCMARLSSKGLGSSRSRKIQFTNRGGGVETALLEKPIQSRPGKYGLNAVRIMRDAPGVYRIDRAEAVAGTWMPWEAINSVEYPTAAKAKAAVRRWAKSIGARGAE
jgi:hypothetical protein